MRKIVLAAALSAVALSGCSTLSTNLTTQTSAQVTTLAAAIQATTLVDQAADTYVNAGSPSKAQLTEIQTLATSVHTELQALETAQSAGQSLVFTSFNNALSAFQQYEAANTASSASTAASA